MSETSQEWRGKVGGMSDEERDAFLERGVVMRLACLDAEGRPYVAAPISVMDAPARIGWSLRPVR